MNHRIESMRPSASMVLMAKAKELQKQDPTVIGLAGGEPDFSTPDRISMAAIRSLSEGYTHYVVGPGLPELRHPEKAAGGKRHRLGRELHSGDPRREKRHLLGRAGPAE